MSAVLRIEQLSVCLPPGADRSRALLDVGLEVSAGELLCLVGESGSGKSILASTVMGLLPAGIRAESGRERSNSSPDPERSSGHRKASMPCGWRSDTETPGPSLGLLHPFSDATPGKDQAVSVRRTPQFKQEDGLFGICEECVTRRPK